MLPRRRPAVIALAAALLLSACSSGSDADRSSADRTSTTSRTSTSTQKKTDETTRPTTDPRKGNDPDQTLIAAVDSTLAVSSFTVDSEAHLQIGAEELTLTAKGSVDYEEVVSSVEIAVEKDGSGFRAEVRSDGTTVWVRREGTEAPPLPDGKVWVEGDAQLLAAASSFQPAGVLGVLFALRAAHGTTVEKEEAINGTSTTQYRTVVTYDEAVEAVGDDLEAFKSALSLNADDPIDLVIDVWIGEDGIVRQFDLDLQAKSSTPLDGTYHLELSRVDQDVTVPSAPPKDEILSGPEADALLDQFIT